MEQRGIALMYLLDTNVISELRKVKQGKADPQVVQWASQQNTANLYISVISILEIEQGILKIERHDPVQGKHLRQWLEQQVLPSFAERVLNLDIKSARQCAALHVPNPTSYRDAMIAAIAITHHLNIVTRNTADFKALGVVLVNPWLPPET